LDQFATAFYDADIVLVSEIYAAGESPIKGISGAHMADAIRQHGHRDVTYFSTNPSMLDALSERIREGDLVVTLGAGDIWQIGQALVERL
jgi:UDP-N-acetylmuramate--alanine ligase